MGEQAGPLVRAGWRVDGGPARALAADRVAEQLDALPQPGQLPRVDSFVLPGCAGEIPAVDDKIEGDEAVDGGGEGRPAEVAVELSLSAGGVVEVRRDRILLADDVLGTAAPEPALDAVEAWLGALVPACLQACEETTRLVERVARDRSIRRVDELAGLAGTTVRALQRRFADHVGISPNG